MEPSSSRIARVAGRLCQQLVQFALVLLGISTVLFLLLRLSGDPVRLLLPPDAPPGSYERIRHELALDAPIYTQYVSFVAGLLRLDFGTSLLLREPALAIVLAHLPATLELTAAAVIFSMLVGFPLGVIGAVGRPSVGRPVAILVAAAGQSMPAYWLGVLLVLVFAVELRVLPSSGQGGITNLILPMVTLGLQLTASVILLVRSGIRREVRADYVRTAQSKGLRTIDVLVRHLLPNVLIPVITVVGVDIGRLMGGAVITESVFAWPGVGRQLVSAVLSRDYPVVEAAVFLIAALVMIINFAADVTYRFIDPRIRG